MRKVSFFLAGLCFVALGVAQPRVGKLQPGDQAPDFDLPLRSSQQKIKLSSFKGHKPVALIFGSYT